jgi:Ti-type conjugative transfer relaxase TraA
VRSAAYNGRDAIEAQRTGELFYFKHRDSPEHHEVLLPEGASAELGTSDALWNAAEAVERRKDAQVAREIVLALPANSELGHDDRVELTRSFAIEHFVSKGLAVQIDVHSPHGADSESERANFHAHLLITTRRVEGEAFAAKKARDLDPTVRMGKGRAVVSEAEAWGATWRDHQNKYFAELGLDIRVDVTSAVPQEHIGPVRMRAPEATANARAEEIKRANELAARDPELVLGVLTRNNATFTRWDVDRHLEKHIPDETERAEVRGKVLGSGQVLGLHDRKTGESVERFTTQSVRSQEREALSDGAHVAAGRHRDIGSGARAAATSSPSLRPDQRAAFEHATGAGGLKVVEGHAGTGKSFTLCAIRDAHQLAGYSVVGLAPTNAVAQDMKRDGFGRASTAHAELFRLKNGIASWDRRTLVVVDETAMMDAKVTGALLREAKLSGAKVVLAGDDRQLSSIERGGLFSELKKVHGSSEIREVTRQRVDWQREAARDLSEGRFESALRGFARNKAVFWTNRQDDTRGALVEQWKKDTLADSQASRFVFAYTNKDVDALNKDLRAVRRERGELGVDHTFTTKHGQASFAVGDRVQFTDTLKGAGIYNGNAGIITDIDATTSRVTARLDAAVGREGRQVEWSASDFSGFRHGYAGTIYKGQGKTLDHTYLLHTKHWRAASSYVALTRQRESTKVFVAVETARDLRELARQIGRSEIKSASVAYATLDELTPEQRETQRASEQARVTAQQKAGMETVGLAKGSKMERQRPGVRGELESRGRQAELGRSSVQNSPLRPTREVFEIAPAPGAAEAGKVKADQSVPAAGPVAGRANQEVTPNPNSETSNVPAAKTAMREILIPAFDGREAEGVVRDSLGRGLDAKSIASVVAADARVQREYADRAIYIQTAYRAPKMADASLDELLARDGALSAARRLSVEPGLLGELRGREGFFAGQTARVERRNAINAATAIGPNVTRTAEVEAQVARTYRDSVEVQNAADGTPIPKLSERAVAALSAVGMAKTDAERADAAKALVAAPEVNGEVDRFRTAVKARFGEDGARAMSRAAAAGTTFEHKSVPKAQLTALQTATKLYAAARGAEREIARSVEAERISLRQSQGPKLKP